MPPQASPQMAFGARSGGLWHCRPTSWAASRPGRHEYQAAVLQGQWRLRQHLGELLAVVATSRLPQGLLVPGAVAFDGPHPGMHEAEQVVDSIRMPSWTTTRSYADIRPR